MKSRHKTPKQLNVVLLVFVVLQSIFSLGAQSYYVYWYFGERAGIRFEKGVPHAVTDGVLNTAEGSVTLSSETGELLFYSDGVTVWNRQHHVMLNGRDLEGHSSSTQSALAVQRPGSAYLFDLFTAGVQEASSYNWGIRHSVIDMRGDGGLGEVVQKNQSILARGTEKLTAVRHANGKDYWILTRGYGNKYYAWLLTDSGLLNIPVVSLAGFDIAVLAQAHTGYMRVSPDGNRIANISPTHGIELLNFNPSDGVVSELNMIEIEDKTHGYGLEFSSNGQYLYHTAGRNLWQYNLKAGTSDEILNTRYKVYESRKNSFTSIALGLDGRIYCAVTRMPYLSFIDSPDIAHKGCAFKLEAIDLKARFNNAGLPNIPYMRRSWIEVDSLCFGRKTKFNLIANYTFDSVRWSFGDALAGSQNTAKGKAVAHLYSGVGYFTVKAKVYYKERIDSVFKQIFIIAAKKPIALGNDTFLCPGDTFQLHAGSGYTHYRWQNGDRDSVFTVTKPGIYSVRAIDGCGTHSDTVVILYETRPGLLADTLICAGDTLEVYGSNYRAVFRLLEDTAAFFKHRISASGLYLVRMQFTHCAASDTFKLGNIPLPETNLGNDTMICGYADFELKTDMLCDSVRWSNGSRDLSITDKNGGLYNLQVMRNGCIGRDSIYIERRPNPEPNLGPDTVFCEPSVLLLKPGMACDSLYWSNGSRSEWLAVKASGTYSVLVLKDGCTGVDTVMVTVKPGPEPELGMDTVLCDAVSFFIQPAVGYDSIRWSDGSSNPFLEVTSGGEYAVAVMKDGCVGRDTIRIIRSFIPQSVFPDSMALCFGGNITLDAGPDAAWSDASFPRFRVITQPGLYSIRISNACGVLDDSVQVVGTDCTCYLEMPSAFTPNGDGLNDFFLPVVQGCAFETYQLVVFNRWGQKMFETNNLSVGWNGSYMGKTLPEGVYVYFISGVDGWRKRHAYKGNVSLLR